MPSIRRRHACVHALPLLGGTRHSSFLCLYACAFLQQHRLVAVAPATVADLLRRRIRVTTGNAQASAAGVRRPGSATTLPGLARMVRARPQLAVHLPVFLVVALVARLSARRAVRAGDYTTWLRDESSRA